MSLIVDYYIPEKVRAECVKELSALLPKKTAALVEEGIYDYVEQFSRSRTFYLEYAIAPYKDKKKDIIFNLKQKGNTITEILEMIESHEFNAYNMAFLRPEELNKDAWIRIVLRMKMTEEQLNNLPSVKWKKCFGCQSNDYFMYQLQTRSVDEPMTTFYICKQCGKNYRI